MYYLIFWFNYSNFVQKKEKYYLASVILNLNIKQHILGGMESQKGKLRYKMDNAKCRQSEQSRGPWHWPTKWEVGVGGGRAWALKNGDKSHWACTTLKGTFESL